MHLFLKFKNRYKIIILDKLNQNTTHSILFYTVKNASFTCK